MTLELKGISAMARELGCTETTVRRMDWLLKPARDSSGKRLYTPENVAAAKEHLSRPRKIGVRNALPGKPVAA
ncbi:MAG: hypothetical protein R3E75_08205 [Steroidobacteraceae bacterium]|nr:hypothetical protein [Nevskiaceae bacterium]MCP5472284.1 hypothetical protein [Nevskiaceae bacterium]